MSRGVRGERGAWQSGRGSTRSSGHFAVEPRGCAALHGGHAWITQGAGTWQSGWEPPPGSSPRCSGAAWLHSPSWCACMDYAGRRPEMQHFPFCASVAAALRSVLSHAFTAA